MTRIGIIGSEAVAHIHIGGLLTNNCYEIAGCYAPDNRQSMVFARQYRLISYSSPEALFKYADAVDIADDLPETMALAEMSLKAMKHVFIAQPGRLSLDQMKYLKKLAEESGMVLQLGTGYRHCPAYDMLLQSVQTARQIDIRHQLLNSNNLFAQIATSLSHDLDFLTSIVNASICKIDVKAWTKPEVSPDVLNCRLECDNGCLVNIVAYAVAEGEPKLEFIFTSSDAVIRADIFKSVVEKQYRSYDVADNIILDAYKEKNIHKYYLKNFYQAICNEGDAIRCIDNQFQNMAAADFIVERAKQLQPAY